MFTQVMDSQVKKERTLDIKKEETSDSKWLLHTRMQAFHEKTKIFTQKIKLKRDDQTYKFVPTF